MREQMNASMTDMAERIGGIIGIVKTLPADEYTVIARRYMLGQSMETVSALTFVSTRKCWSIHGRAIRRLSENVHTFAE